MIRRTTVAAATATVLLSAPAAWADPQAGVAFDATDAVCSLVGPGLNCVHFTAQAVAAYRLGEDGVLRNDTEATCTATAPGATFVRLSCSVNGRALPGTAAVGPTTTTAGTVNLPQDYSLEICYSAVATFPAITFSTSTICSSYDIPVGL